MTMWRHIKADLRSAGGSFGDSLFYLGQAFKTTLASIFGERTERGVRFRSTYYCVDRDER